MTGTNKFREFVDLMSNQDLSTASNEEIVAAYESAIPKIKRYFTEGQEGAVNFLKDIQDINSEWAHINDDGSWKIDFGVGNDQEIADKLGIDVEAVQAVMRKLKDYGFDINLDQPVQSLDELKTSAESAKESLVDMNGYVTGSHGKLAYEGAHSLGTAFSNGTGKFNVGSSGSKSSSSSKKKSSKSSKSSSNNSSSSSSKSNSSSDSSNDKEETKETLDWIETKLDRIKRKIDELDTTASSTYRTWSKRNEALSSELSKVTEKISLQQQAYDRYIKEAESAGEGLSSDWIDKIQNGKIDIETITDSDLKEKISDYKNW